MGSLQNIYLCVAFHYGSQFWRNTCLCFLNLCWQPSITTHNSRPAFPERARCEAASSQMWRDFKQQRKTSPPTSEQRSSFLFLSLRRQTLGSWRCYRTQVIEQFHSTKRKWCRRRQMKSREELFDQNVRSSAACVDMSWHGRAGEEPPLLPALVPTFPAETIRKKGLGILHGALLTAHTCKLFQILKKNKL